MASHTNIHFVAPPQQLFRQITYVHLDGGGSLAVLGGNSGGLDDLDRFVAGSVATGHIVV
jgi:hypothetical protein